MVKYKINKFYFVKNEGSLVILLIIGFAFLVYLFPFNAVFAAKIQSGVTVIAPATTPPPAGTCTDGNGDGVDDVTGQPCSPTGATPAGTCGLQIVSGVPINYGQLTPGQTSAEKQVMIKNEGTSQTPAKLMIKGGNWVSDSAPAGATAASSTISGPEVTRASIAPVDFNSKKSLSLTGWELGQLTGGQSIPVYFQFLTWANAPSGSFHQDVTIDLLC
jgi:hypothetical protein